MSQHCFRAQRRHEAKKKQDQTILELRLQLATANYELQELRISFLLNAVSPAGVKPATMDYASQTDQKMFSDMEVRTLVEYSNACSIAITKKWEETLQIAEQKIASLIAQASYKNAEITRLTNALDEREHVTASSCDAACQVEPNDCLSLLRSHQENKELDFLMEVDLICVSAASRRHLELVVGSGRRLMQHQLGALHPLSLLRASLASATTFLTATSNFSDWLCDQQDGMTSAFQVATARQLLLDAICRCISPRLGRRFLKELPRPCRAGGFQKLSNLWNLLEDVGTVLLTLDDENELAEYWEAAYEDG
eukprot:TRINITY_DN109049_c0_g1_i1.p1 TRINITY_DN109049_c0_g1~~TRINITY_DN109049_c0_g1_i1.p1  ORF type:complete len:344 (-),score=59.02 TRINITY_DN109049_c0_g1_i1:116-1045(-)